MNVLILVIIAIIPPLAFLLYIHHLDRIEPEPHGLIIKAMALGAAAVIPAAAVESILWLVPAFAIGGPAGAVVKSFVVIAPIEELVKLGSVMLFIWKDANFNEENDGIVYVGAAAIGFSLVENILYVVQSGLATGILRAVTSIPLHTFTGVLMGYFVGIAKMAPSASARNRNIAAGFSIAYLVHAVYDTLAFSGTAIALLIVPLVIVLIVFGVIYLKKGAQLSGLRWKGTAGASAPLSGTAAEPVTTRTSASQPHAAGPEFFKIVLSRIIFSMCACFWGLLIIGLNSKNTGKTGSILEAFAGGIIITFIPIVIGVLLELSYYRRKKSPGRRHDATNSIQA